jgi:hypothetical protein
MYLYGARVDALAQSFKKHGYSIHDDNAQGSQGAVLPQHLYDEKSFGPLADALSVQSRAELALSQAKAADARNTVERLWNSA